MPCPEEYSGKDADILFSNGYTLHVTGFTINEVLDIVNASSTDSNWKLNLAGLRDVSGSYTCREDRDNPLIQIGATGLAIFQGLPGNPFTYYGVEILISGMGRNVPHDGPADVTYDWVSTGCVEPYVGTTTTAAP